MRCVIVNGANLKSDASCARCGGRIGEAYIREIHTRLTYCNYYCYSLAVETSDLARDRRTTARSDWTRAS